MDKNKTKNMKKKFQLWPMLAHMNWDLFAGFMVFHRTENIVCYSSSSFHCFLRKLIDRLCGGGKRRRKGFTTIECNGEHSQELFAIVSQTESLWFPPFRCRFRAASKPQQQVNNQLSLFNLLKCLMAIYHKIYGNKFKQKANKKNSKQANYCIVYISRRCYTHNIKI